MEFRRCASVAVAQSSHGLRRFSAANDESRAGCFWPGRTSSHESEITNPELVTRESKSRCTSGFLRGSNRESRAGYSGGGGASHGSRITSWFFGCAKHGSRITSRWFGRGGGRESSHHESQAGLAPVFQERDSRLGYLCPCRTSSLESRACFWVPRIPNPESLITSRARITGGVTSQSGLAKSHMH